MGEKNGRLTVDGVNIGSKLVYDTDKTDLDGKIAKDMQWAHYDIYIDLLNKTMTYYVKSLDGLQTYTSAEKKVFTDINCEAVTGIETYSWLKGEQVSLDNLHIKSSVPEAQAKISGVKTISKTKGNVITKIYSIEKNYADDTDVFEWSVSGVDGVAIDKNTGALSVKGVAGNGTATITATVAKSKKLTVGEKLIFNIKILDFAVTKKFEITSSDKIIDISALETYGTDSFRLYKTDGSYETVKVDNGTVVNLTGGEVTVVPEYKFEFTNQTNPTDSLIAGYVKVGEDSYKDGKGYGLTSENYNINENGCSPKDGRVIKVDLPDGFYDITLYRIGRGHTDVYANGIQIIQNTSSVMAQNRASETGIMYSSGVKIEGGNANISFGNCGDKERIASVKIAYVPGFARKSVVWVAGDSESADYYPIDLNGSDLDNSKIMMTGFGMQLSKLLLDKYFVANFGQQSATSQSWAEESLSSVEYHIQKGDIFIINFGINDGHKNLGIDKTKKYITQMVEVAKEAQAQAILVSPVYNMDYQKKSYFTYNTKTGKNELEDFAKELGVPFIDLNRYTQEYIEKAKAETGDAKWTENNYHIEDTLHLTQHSALLVADFIAAGLKKLGYETTDFSYTYKDISGTSKDIDGNIIRGAETGVKREYSIKAVEESVSLYNPTKTQTKKTEAIKSNSQGKILYSENFEKYDIGSKGGWQSPYGTIQVVEDEEKGKYLQKTSEGTGKARTGYIELPFAISKDFVFEADLKTEYAGNISSFEIVETRKSIYINHGVYSNQQYAFKLARPKNENLFVVNNKISDSGLTLDKYSQPTVVTDKIESNSWVHIKVVGDFENKTTIAYITSLDGTKEYYHGMTKMSDGMNNFKCLSIISPSNDKYTCIDNIVIREATAEDKSPKYHIVTISDFGNSFEQYVLDGESVVNIPDTSIYGDKFEGWMLDGKLYSADELAKAVITEDCIITSKISERYIEPLETVEFNEFPEGNVLVMGEDSNTFADNKISLKITGQRGTSFVLSPDKKVEDYSIEWSFDGFRTIDGKSTGEIGSNYCDSYALVEITQKAQTSVNFRLKNTAANYYGKVTVKVTYNGESRTISRALVVLGDKSSNKIFPKMGYTSDFSKYEDSMIDTKINDDMAVAFGHWNMSDISKDAYAKLEKEDDIKFIRLTKNSSSGISQIHNSIETLENQAVFEQQVRFNTDGGYICYTDGNNPVKEDVLKEAFRIEFNGKSIKFNGKQIIEAQKNVWYTIKVTVAPTTMLASCKIYDISGKLIGESELVNYSGKVSSQKYYAVRLSKEGTVDINNVRVTDTSINKETFNVMVDEIIQIPENGNKTIELIAKANVIDGFEAIDKAIWKIDTMMKGISIKTDEKNVHKAILTVSSEAATGYLSVNCIIDNVTVTKIIKLTGKNDNIAFISAPSSIMISSEKNITSSFKAVVRNGQAEEILDRTITYSVNSKTSDVSINTSSGILTIKKGAKPQTVTVIAKSKNSDGKEIANSVEVNIYNLKFCFNMEKDGYTTVNEDTLYSDIRGYGIVGTANSDNKGLSGNGFGFSIKLEKGNVYKVTVEHEGELIYEKVDEYFTGIIPNNKFISGNSINIALVGDDVLDIALTGKGSISAIEIVKLEREKKTKPNWWTIGDSTVSQDGSWGATLSSAKIDVEYPELALVIDKFHNSGSAGRHHKSFYTQGWFNYILANMSPGDIVSISGMGTNDSSSTKELFVQFNNFYIDAIKQMGGYVILGTYTPTGNYGNTAGKVYDMDNMAFNGKRNLVYDQAIREVYELRKNEEQIIGFIDIGKICDDKLTADVRKVYSEIKLSNKSEEEARNAANVRAMELMGWWKDYNHYYNTLSNYFLPELTKEIAKIIKYNAI